MKCDEITLYSANHGPRQKAGERCRYVMPLVLNHQNGGQTANETGGTTSQVIPKKPGMVNAYAPDSPFANSEGLVGTPNVDLAEEAVNLKLAEISYKANLSVLKTAQDMTEELLNTVNKKV